jgi:hypothetical protein
MNHKAINQYYKVYQAIKKFMCGQKDTQKEKHENLETTFSDKFLVIAARSQFHIIY